LTGLTLDSAGLVSSLDEAVATAAERKGRTVASVTVPVECPDPAAVVFASRRASEPWFCWEQPDRGVAIASLGRVASVLSRGDGRFREVAAECAHLSGEAVVANSALNSPATGPIWVGGFAFSDDGAVSPQWSSFEPAAMTLPEISFSSDPSGTTLTVNAVVERGADPHPIAAELSARVAALRSEGLPMLDPHPSHRPSIESTRTPGQFESSVSAAVDRIRKGDIEKVVLAREVVVRSGSAHDPAAIFSAIREGFPSCFNFCVGTPEAAFIGASPELLVRCAGRSVSTVGLAGSTRRSSDPAVDDHLAEKLLASSKDRAEQGLVVEGIVKALSRLSVWVEATEEPEIIKVANIQHLATPVVAQLAQPRTAIELAGILHPTPAVGGEPWKKASRVMDEVEGLDRGWYAGPVGWMDGSGDGEFCVALRSALLRDREAHLYAGVGVVADSDPAAELAETEMKLGALLPLIGS
jgi:salicylate biosynthesis isochorismate synthase/menaquinone-specific isochorismate synthase